MNNAKRTFKLVVGVITFALLLYVLFNPQRVRYSVVDWYRRSNFQPTQEVSQIIERIDLTEGGDNLFSATKPQLVQPQNFSSVCPSVEESNVLGCYSSDLTYILDVDEEVLERVEDVTAVHELLHGVWARLSNGEKETLARQLNQVFESSNDQRLIDLVQSYKESDSGDDPLFIANELHSILGTEVAELPLELENHYAKYLQDRKLIVDFFASYNSEFERREERIAELQDTIAELRQKITAKNERIDQLSAENDQLVARINELREQGRNEESNQLVPRQNALVAQIRREVNAVNDLISQFNDNVEENNSLAFELNQLVDSLDSRAQAQ